MLHDYDQEISYKIVFSLITLSNFRYLQKRNCLCTCLPKCDFHNSTYCTLYYVTSYLWFPQFGSGSGQNGRICNTAGMDSILPSKILLKSREKSRNPPTPSTDSFRPPPLPPGLSPPPHPTPTPLLKKFPRRISSSNKTVNKKKPCCTSGVSVERFS